MSAFTPLDLYYFREGTHERLFEKFGYHSGHFAVWAPDAAYVSVIGDFNGWDNRATPLRQEVAPDIWEGDVSPLADGALYKFYVEAGGVGRDLPDPFAFHYERPPGDASIVAAPPCGRARSGWVPSSVAAICAGPPAAARAMGFTHALVSPARGFAPQDRTPDDVLAEIDRLHNQGLGAALEVGVRAEFVRSAATFWRECYGVDLIVDADAEWHANIMRYIGTDPFFRKYQHEALTSLPARDVLALRAAPDYIHGSRLPTLRVLLTLLYAMPGKKLVAPIEEPGIGLLIGQLNQLYKTLRPLHAGEFEWVEPADAERNIVALLRRSGGEVVLFVANFAPVLRLNYRVGAPARGVWHEILNTDGSEYGGDGHGNFGGVESAPIPLHGQRYSLTLTVPPLAGLLLRPEA